MLKGILFCCSSFVFCDFVVGEGQKEECLVDIMNDEPGEGRTITFLPLWIRIVDVV
jgi:hypothetical protein